MTSGIASAASVAPAMMSPLTFEGSIGRMPPRNAGALRRWLVADVVKTSLPPPTAGTGAWTVSRDCALRARDASAQGAPKRWRDTLIVWHDRRDVAASVAGPLDA